MNTIQSKLKLELSAELSNILDFWMQNTIDKKNGGFFGEIDGNNKVVKDAPKGSVLNARILWTFSSAYRVTKNDAYLKIADRAFKYMQDYFLDKKYGGVYWELDYQGKPSNSRKQIYAIAFTIYGMAEYNRVTKNKEALDIAVNLFEQIEKYSFDWQRNGYFEALSEQWELLEDVRLSPRDANERKTMNTHLHIMEAYASLYRVYKNEKLAKALGNLVELFMDKFINHKLNLNLFFNDDWELKSDEISYGHDIECAWLLHEAAEVLGNKTLLEKTERIAVDMAQVALKGIAEDGGMIYEEFSKENKFDTDKHWWPQAEALVGFYNAFQISGNNDFYEKAVNVWDFTKAYIIDHENGEWFWRVNENNEPNAADVKTGFWKCPYHNGRACLEIMERIK